MIEPADNILRLRRRMTEAEFDAERARLRATFGEGRSEPGIRREQELARLYHRSDWTHRELAEKEKQSHTQITRKIRFGRFLDLVPPGHQDLGRLTEKRFRSHWQQTDKTEIEQVRFHRVLALVKSEPGPVAGRKPGRLTRIIIEKFSDSEWHLLEDIAAAIGATTAEVRAVLDRLKAKDALACQRKKYGTSYKYRLSHRDGKAVPVVLLVKEFTPVIEELKKEGRKNIARASPAAVAVLATQLEKLLTKWRE